MFDPTAFDNWKVVVEGALYDLDREGTLMVAGREDLIDLAGMSRSFRMQAALPNDTNRAELRLLSDMADFVGERHDIRLTEEPPGIRLELRFLLPGERITEVVKLHEKLESLWQHEAEVQHLVRIAVDPYQPQISTAPKQSEYTILLTFHEKWGEDRLGDIDVLQERLIESLKAIR